MCRGRDHRRWRRSSGEHPDQKRSRHVHQVGRLLGGELGVRPYQGHPLACGHVGQDGDQEINGSAGDRDTSSPSASTVNRQPQPSTAGVGSPTAAATAI
jgi:hypothetical protein